MRLMPWILHNVSNMELQSTLADNGLFEQCRVSHARMPRSTSVLSGAECERSVMPVVPSS